MVFISLQSLHSFINLLRGKDKLIRPVSSQISNFLQYASSFKYVDTFLPRINYNIFTFTGIKINLVKSNLFLLASNPISQKILIKSWPGYQIRLSN